MIRLFTDTSANLSPAILREHNIELVHFHYSINDEVIEYNTIEGFDGKSFYKAMREGADIKTSMVNIVDYMKAFEPALQNGDDVLYVGMAGGISGAIASAKIAASELQESYPERSIIIFDSYAASLGEGMHVLDAAELIEKGERIDVVVNELYHRREHLCQYFTVDDMKYLKKGGRVSGAVSFAGSLLNVKPILMGDNTGHIVFNGVARGEKRAIATLADKYQKLCSDMSLDISIAHADNEEGAMALLEQLKAIGFIGNAMIEQYEPVTGGHAGPGTIALFFRGIHK
ncbi:MAG: DegV family protein [Oscillospiraceae bacterium]|nr:DegV family protein [Oscillospiraceae bacterium]